MNTDMNVVDTPQEDRRGRIIKEIQDSLKLAWPLILANLASNAMQFIDSIMLGRYSQQALAGVAVGGAFFHLLFIIFQGILMAVGPMVAQAFGAKDEEELKRSLRSGVFLAVGISFLPMLVFLNSEDILTWMRQPPVIVPDAASYLGILALGMPFFLGYFACKSFLEGLGNTRSVLFIVLGALLVNVVLNYSLIFGNFGLPTLGLKGAAIATLVSYIVMAVAAFLYILSGYSHLNWNFRRWRPEFSHIAQIFKLGLPIGLSLGFEGGMFAAVVFLMGQFGVAALAAQQITVQMTSLTFMIPLGIAIAGSVRVGQAVGAQDLRGARRAGYVSMGLAVFVMCFSASAYVLIPDKIIALFIDIQDPANAEMLRLGVGFFAMSAAFQLFDGLQVSAASALRGFKDTRVPMLMAWFSYWPVGIGLGMFFAFRLGMEGRGLWLGLVFGLALAGALQVARFRYISNHRIAEA